MHQDDAKNQAVVLLYNKKDCNCADSKANYPPTPRYCNFKLDTLTCSCPCPPTTNNAAEESILEMCGESNKLFLGKLSFEWCKDPWNFDTKPNNFTRATMGSLLWLLEIQRVLTRKARKVVAKARSPCNPRLIKVHKVSLLCLKPHPFQQILPLNVAQKFLYFPAFRVKKTASEKLRCNVQKTWLIED